MNIGEEQKKVTVEPLENPVPQRREAPPTPREPAEAPQPAPAEQPAEPVPA